MAKKTYTTMSEESIRYLCGLINKIVSLPTDIISNINLADNLTFSNIHIKNLIDQCLQDANAEAEKLVGALTHLTCKETAVQPTLDNSEINVIYLYSADGNPPYQQFLKISDTKLVDLGSTSVSLTDYLTITSAASTYAKQTDLKTLSDEVSGIKTKIGSGSLDTTSDTLVGAINEVANKSTIVSLTKAEYDALATKDPETYYIITDDEQSVSITTTINSSSTDSEIPTAKAVNDSYHIKTYTTPEQLGLADGCSVSDIFLALPNNSYFECGQNTTKTNVLYNITGVPTNGGLLTIRKQTEFRFSIEYKISGGGNLSPNQLYIGQLKGADGSGLEWQRVVTTTVEDVPVTNVTDTLVSGNASGGTLSYYVKDGTCYVEFDGIVIDSASSGGGLSSFTFPLPYLNRRSGYKTIQSWKGNNVVQVSVMSNGKIAYWCEVSAVGSAFYGQFSYPVAES